MHLHRVRRPFLVDFTWLAEGIRIKGQWFPILKMRWVEGLTLNQFLEEYIEHRAALNQLAALWLKLGRELRDARGELARKARAVGLEVLEDVYLASLLYPAFWLVKQRNRRLLDGLEGEQLERRVAADIAGTADSRIGWVLRRVEELLRLRLPFGVRGLLTLQRGAGR